MIAKIPTTTKIPNLLTLRTSATTIPPTSSLSTKVAASHLRSRPKEYVDGTTEKLATNPLTSKPKSTLVEATTENIKFLESNKTKGNLF